MTSVCHPASNHERLDTRVVLGACILRTEAGFGTHLVATVVGPDVVKIASGGVTVRSPRDRWARTGELAGMLDQLVADEAGS